MKPALLLLAVTVALSACGGGEAPEPAPERKPKPAPARERASGEWPPSARCPDSLGSNCRSARGTILYVERVDPDGDGDAHFVLASASSISGPGITAVDVRRSLRPRPLPVAGDRVSAAGPVYRGSFGQRQIEAVELHVRRARRR